MPVSSSPSAIRLANFLGKQRATSGDVPMRFFCVIFYGFWVFVSWVF